MTIPTLILIAATLAAVSGTPAETVHPGHPVETVGNCKQVLAAAGAGERFVEHAGHAIHSLTVDDLKRFEPTVTADNRVPTVNRNMVGTEGVLRSAPDLKAADGSTFKTDVMKVLDTVLMEMDNPEYFRRYTSFVERVAHEAHMFEHWAHVLEQYKEVGLNPPGDEFCSCAMDVDNNGLMDVLRNAALLIREPGLTLGYDPSNYTQADLRMYMLYAVVVYPEKLTHDLFKRPEQYQLNGMEAWVYFKEHYGENHEETRDAALFLHCALMDEREAAARMRSNQ